jgi:hypothetical protein
MPASSGPCCSSWRLVRDRGRPPAGRGPSAHSGTACQPFKSATGEFPGIGREPGCSDGVRVTQERRLQISQASVEVGVWTLGRARDSRTATFFNEGRVDSLVVTAPEERGARSGRSRVDSDHAKSTMPRPHTLTRGSRVWPNLSRGVSPGGLYGRSDEHRRND